MSTDDAQQSRRLALLQYDVRTFFRLYGPQRDGGPADADAAVCSALALVRSGQLTHAEVLSGMRRVFGVSSAAHRLHVLTAFYDAHAPEQVYKARNAATLAVPLHELLRLLHQKYKVALPPELSQPSAEPPVRAAGAATSAARAMGPGAGKTVAQPSENPPSAVPPAVDTAGATPNSTTALLHALHMEAHAALSEQQRIALVRHAQEERECRRAVVADPYAEASSTITEAVRAVCSGARRAVVAAISGLDAMLLLPDVEKEIALADAGVSAAQQQVSQLRERVERDTAVLRNQVQGRDLQLHHLGVIMALDEQLAATQRMVRLTREEIDARKTAAFAHARIGVLHCDDWSRQAGSSRGPRNPTAAAAAGSASVAAEGAWTPQRPVAVSAAVRSLVGAARSTLSSGGAQHAEGGARVGELLSRSAAAVAGATSRGAFLARGAPASSVGATSAATGSAAAVARVPPIPVQQYSEDEMKMLHVEHEQLVQRQRQSALQEAREVELAAQEISRLSSLMNEKLTVQSESLLAVDAETERAVETLAKTVDVLKQPAKSWWNATRSLILALWVSTATICAAHHVVR